MNQTAIGMGHIKELRAAIASKLSHNSALVVFFAISVNAGSPVIFFLLGLDLGWKESFEKVCEADIEVV